MIYRLDKTKGNFVQVHKKLVDDNNLTANAKAILIYMLSKNDNWQFYELDITKHFSDNVKIVRKGIKELIDKKYIDRNKLRDITGKYVYSYDIYEQPELYEKENEGEF